MKPTIETAWGTRIISIYNAHWNYFYDTEIITNYIYYV